MKFLLWYSTIVMSLAVISNVGMALGVAFTWERFLETETEIRLQPLNDRYPDAIIRKDSRADFRVIGKVVDMRPNL